MTTLKERFAILAGLHPEISQADVARAAGVKPPSANGWFSGASKSMKAAPATAVAALYGVDAHWLATGEGAMRPEKKASILKVRPEGQQLKSAHGQCDGLQGFW